MHLIHALIRTCIHSRTFTLSYFHALVLSHLVMGRRTLSRGGKESRDMLNNYYLALVDTLQQRLDIRSVETERCAHLLLSTSHLRLPLHTAHLFTSPTSHRQRHTVHVTPSTSHLLLHTFPFTPRFHTFRFTHSFTPADVRFTPSPSHLLFTPSVHTFPFTPSPSHLRLRLLCTQALPDVRDL